MTIHQSPPPSVPLDQPKPMPTTASHGVGAGFPHVAGRCPACRGSSLFLATAGHVTCSRLECPDPCAADDMLHADQPEPPPTMPPTGMLTDTTEAEHDRRMAAGEPVLVVGTPPPWRVEAAPPPTAGTPPPGFVRETLEEALENDRCGICLSTAHFREQCPQATPVPPEVAGRDHHWIQPEQAVSTRPPWRKEPPDPGPDFRRDAFERHLDQHQCGTGDHKSPHYIGGFRHCPEAMSLWELLSDDDQIILAARLKREASDG
jgi:hypothetical protein